MKRISISSLLLVAILLTFFSSCSTVNGDELDFAMEDKLSVNPKTDVHSYANTHEIVAKHLDLDIKIDFETREISGVASYDMDNFGAERAIFDMKDLIIEKVVLENGTELEFEIGKRDSLLGSPLEIKVNPNVERLSIHYRSTTTSQALQWLDPQQTAGKVHPYLFTQGQAILTRTWIPIQDTPGARITYSAKVEVPKELMAVMSASNPSRKNDTGIYTFEMKQAIPSYLIALAAGNLEFREIGPRTGVYTEPSEMDKAAYELGDMEKMVVTAEKLYGPYLWDRYDVIVLPPSFPFGGMENPRLTFATPTILAGDRSLTSLIAHELAHSWSGNLVTNATWNDFWLNEGFTVYFERRIMESLYGEDYANMLSLLGQQDLMATLDEMGHDHKDTHLKLDLEGRDPDEGMNDIAYEKGALFLQNLERATGREKLDAFLRSYFEHYSFQSMTTEDFIDYLNEQLVHKDGLSFNVEAWVYGPGIPKEAYVLNSDRFDRVDDVMSGWVSNRMDAHEIETNSWTYQEWLHFVRSLPSDISYDEMRQLDLAFNLTVSGNSEIKSAWFLKAIEKDYMAIEPELEKFLVQVGRRKFLKPLYKALMDNEKEELARAIYRKAKPNYHSVSSNTIDAIVQ